MRKILAIDDDPEIRELIELFFTEHQMDIRTLSDGSKAMDTIIQYEPDVIILDINLPGKNGIDLLHSFKAHPIVAQIPVIMLTGQSAPTMQINGLVSGADDYITKPFNLEVLYARVLSVLRRSLKQSRQKYGEMNLLNYLVRRYTKRDYTIYTKYLDEYEDYPRYWNAYIPDLIIEKGNKYRCYTFESTQSIIEEAFLERLKLMAQIIVQWHKPVELNIIVRTKDNERSVKKIIVENDLPINVKFIEKSSPSK